MTDDDRATREREIAAQIAALVADAEPQLDVIAADLTALYRKRIPLYDSIAHEEVQRNTRALLDIVVWRLSSDTPAAVEHDVADLVRQWAGQKIPLELVAHSIQLGARELFKLIRHNAMKRDLATSVIDDMQDVVWEWATSYSAVVNAVMQERAVSGATRRADLIRQLIEGSYVPSSLAENAREHGIALDHPYRVACVSWNETSVVSDVRAMLRIRCTSGDRAVVDAVIDNHLVALLPALPDQLDAPVPIGIGRAGAAAEARLSFDQAERALHLAESFGRTGTLDLVALGPLPLLEMGDEAADQLADMHLSPLIERGDAGREILGTVAAYLDNDRRVDDTRCGAVRASQHRP
ncbi:MAG: hypothetical protein U5O16_02355 [Rhodococcus sp. (in: high G+C Gram-positive bacteria)]|uniref:hypothetical protein n=1 Tax=Rhodococcus sp. TaxID=1831 RepID=UPI002AD72246|nr:hypothetical protein [Rhodococcus sp. (in: high G+C Gram-positive bacteria)]